MCTGRAFGSRTLMEEVVTSSMNHVCQGGIPFTAFVVARNGLILGRGVNRVREDHDPTAHAEVEAIRNAYRTHCISNRSGATLLASGEPCAMCYLCARSAGITQVLFAADRNEAAEYGFDYRGSYSLFSEDPMTWDVSSSAKLSVANRLGPFRAFQSQTSP